MIGAIYLLAILVSWAGMWVIDLRYRLFFGAKPRVAAAVLLSGLALFLAWDGAGIAFGVFFRGSAEIMTGIELAPEFPLEELFFLLFLCHLTMVLFTGIGRIRRGKP